MLQIGVAGATIIAEILEGNRVLEHLQLNNCELGDDGIEPIARGEYPYGGSNCSYTLVVALNEIHFVPSCTNINAHNTTNSSLQK